jgi:hypothetical protein
MQGLYFASIHGKLLRYSRARQADGCKVGLATRETTQTPAIDAAKGAGERAHLAVEVEGLRGTLTIQVVNRSLPLRALNRTPVGICCTAKTVGIRSTAKTSQQVGLICVPSS